MDPPVQSRRRVGSTHSRPVSSVVPTPTYSNVSSHKNRYFEVQLYSPALAVSEEAGSGPIAVFGDHDQLGGQVILHPGCPETGRVNLTVEGFIMLPESCKGDQSPGLDQPASGSRKSIFLSINHSFSIDASAGDQETSRSTIRDAFGPRRRPSVPSLRIRPSYSSQDRAFPFTITLPQGARHGEDKPPSYTSTASDSGKEAFSIAYSVTASWYATDLSHDSVTLDIPFMLLPDHDFSSLDGVQDREDSWLEMPLRCDRPAPYRCAVTLPTSVTFSRPSAIPFFVVFTTVPRSSDLAREITADATISISLLRQIVITEAPILPPTPPLTPYSHSSSGSEDMSEPTRPGRLRRLKRTIKTSVSMRSPIGAPPVPPLPSPFAEEQEKQLPRLPQQTIWTQSRILHTCFSPGFPKRPRLTHEGRKHPSIEELASMPDGLFKSKITLEKEMLQSIDWPGVSVKYYLDVSVLVRQDDFRARVPIRIL